MSKAFLIDTTKCMGCHDCVVSCKDEFIDNDWSPYSAPQPAMGHFWMKLNIVERGQMPGKMKVTNLPLLCNQCTSPPCVAQSTGGAVYVRKDGLVVIDPAKSKGQTQLLSQAACPYGVIYWNPDLAIPQKCDGCAHLLDNGWTEPRCVNSCPTGALQFGELSDLQSQIQASGAVPLHPEFGTGPQVYYVGLPKTFIAGSVFSHNTGESVKDAKVTVTSGSYSASVTSDIYGDFWVDGLDANKSYTVAISATGYAQKSLTVSLGTDTDLGDIELLSA